MVHELRKVGTGLRTFRTGKPGTYPDQAIYAEYACAEFGLAFACIDGGTGLVFRVASPAASLHFAAGRCSWYPQNSATASSLASDKYFTNVVLERSGVPTLGGDYFFLNDRHRASRPDGHDRDDALAYFRTCGGAAFAKPLMGARGDFAQAIASEAALSSYLRDVSQFYDSILIQPIFSGREYRVFLLDGEAVYTARKCPPALLGDGERSIRQLLAAHDADLRLRGLSPAAVAADTASLDLVLRQGQRWEIPGRMNLSAGGTMTLEAPPSEAVLTLASRAANALGLRAAAVDLFADIDGDSHANRIIEVNANPAIRLLEDSDREDLILKIWRHAFSATGLIGA